MSAELSLFDDNQDMAELIMQIERLADKKSIAFNSSFGISKNRVGAIRYSSMLVLFSNAKKNETQMITGNSINDVLQQTKTFLQQL